MKKIIFALSLLTLSLSTPSAFAKGPFGLGGIIGDPSGLSAKYYLNDTHAIDAAAAWSLGDSDAFGIHADYLIHVPAMVRIDNAVFPMHYGIGAILFLSKHANGFGVRAPIGLNYNFESQPIDLFLEIAGILALAPETDFDIQLALGARYYF